MTETMRSSTDYYDESPKRRLFFAGGLGYDAGRNRQVLSYLAGRGYDTAPALANPAFEKLDTSFQIVRDGSLQQISTKEAMNAASRPESTMVISNYQLSRADELIRTLDGTGGEVDAIFQSADALSGVLAMYRRPDLFHSAVLAYPAGIVKQRHPAIAAGGIVRSIYKNNVAKVPPENNFEPDRGKLQQIASTAIGKAIVNSGGLSHQAGLLTGIAKQKDAPEISIAVGTEDWMFRPDHVIQSLGRPDDIDYLLVTNTPHGINGRKDVMDDVLELFPRMEELRQVKTSGGDIGPLAERLVFTDDVPRKIRAKLTALAIQSDTTH